MTTGGEGGMTLFREEGVWDKARSFRDHGKDYPLLASLSGSNSFPWPHRSIGSNYRLTEMQSAIGRIQLQKLVGWLEKRRANALLFEQIFQDHPAIQTMETPNYMTHAHYRFYGRVNQGWDRDAILTKARAAGVPMERGACGQIQKEKAFAAWPDIHEREYPGGAAWHDHGFALPTHPTLQESHIRRMADVLLDVLDSCEP